MKSTHTVTERFASQDSLGYLVNAAARLFAKNLYAKLKAYDLGPGEWPVLLTLFEQDGLAQKDISARLQIEDATVVRTLDRLEKKDWVQRVRSTQDRRVINVFLKSKAHQHKEALIACAVDVNQKAVQGLKQSEQVEFKQQLKQMIEALAL